VRTGLAIMGFLAVLGACGEDAGLTCVNGYVLDGERCVFRDYATGGYDAGASEELTDASTEEPVDASPCDASAAHDETSDADAAPCSADAAAQEDDEGE
jgi:hypothetical protein